MLRRISDDHYENEGMDEMMDNATPNFSWTPEKTFLNEKMGRPTCDALYFHEKKLCPAVSIHKYGAYAVAHDSRLANPAKSINM